MALHEGNSSGAIDDLVPHGSYGMAQVGPIGAMLPVYLRGMAYLAERNGAAASAEFQKIVDNPGVVQNQPIGVLAYLGLGRAFVFQSDTAKARESYQKFLTLWKDAEPDIPVLQQAKAEYAKLQ